jgi:hypothetical protein
VKDFFQHKLKAINVDKKVVDGRLLLHLDQAKVVMA